MDNDKKLLRYKISGAIEIDAEGPSAAEAKLRTLLAAAREVGEAEADMSVPRLTRVKV